MVESVAADVYYRGEGDADREVGWWNSGESVTRLVLSAAEQIIDGGGSRD